MSTGALTQLAAIGSQDQYLSIQGEVTFWKGVYRRHTNFAVEPIKITFNQTPGWGMECTAVISRTGDLLSKTWLVVELPALNDVDGGDSQTLWRYCDEVGYQLIDHVDLVIGGTVIDSMPGHFLQVWNELTTTEEKKQIQHLVGRSGSESELIEWACAGQRLYIPLQFFFCRHLMQALPLIALQYHDVRIVVKFRRIEDCVAKINGALPADLSKRQFTAQEGGTYLLCNMVYLEEDERKTFASSTHEYLIDILQHDSMSCTGKKSTYNAFFNHPTTELIWTFVSQTAIESNEPFCYSALQQAFNTAGDPMVNAKLQLNGYDRFQAMPAEYFREIVPAQCHTSVPSRPIYVWNFALEPEEWKPTGSLNFSRVDNVKLVCDHIDYSKVSADDAANGLLHPNANQGTEGGVAGGYMRVYARSKNVLRIKSGMAGLAYAN